MQRPLSVEHDRDDGNARAGNLSLLHLALTAAIDLVRSDDPALADELRRCERLVRVRRDRSDAADEDHDHVGPVGGWGVPEGLAIVRAPLVIHGGEREDRPRSGGMEDAVDRADGDRDAVDRVPRISYVLERLMRRGLKPGDVRAYVDPSYENARRGDLSASGRAQGSGYVLLAVDRLGLEIAVSDEPNQATFVGVGLRGPDYWNEATKQQIADTVDIDSIPFRHAAQYTRRLDDALDGAMGTGGEPSDTVIDRPHEYDAELVEQCVEAHWHAHGEMPTQGSGIVRHGPYANGKTTWKAIGLALYKKRRDDEARRHGPVADGAVAAEGEPRGPPTLTDIARTVARRVGAFDPYAFRTLPMNEDGVRRTIMEHREATGEWPSITADVVEVGPYANAVTWRGIDDALRRGHRGLPGGSSLATMREELATAIGPGRE